MRFINSIIYEFAYLVKRICTHLRTFCYLHKNSTQIRTQYTKFLQKYENAYKYIDVLAF
nr:MAG TPA: hypothetical protein [Caudoviricetes sp.]